MILYFSGTGNSRFVAESLANLTADEAINAFEYIQNKREGDFCSEPPFVFVSPTYAWRIPRIFERWIRSSRFSGKRAYFVMTCGSDIGDAAHYLQKLCRGIGLEFGGVAPVVMPENYVAMFPVPDGETAERMTHAAGRRVLPGIAKTILAGSTLIPPKRGVVGWLESHPINPLFYCFSIKSKPFFATDKCIGCGKCAERCPLTNITLTEGKPRWGGECTHCMACICGCPAQAIEYGKKSIGKPRVWNTTPPVTCDEVKMP